jgi:phosphoribosylaminoimidazolecarboxamide formyltransferase/IMP cyclohydrolase
MKKEDFFLASAKTPKGKEYKIEREPTERELDDMLFGWLVEAGITSNSVIYVKDGATVGIGTGEQDRVGVSEIARDKAYTKLKDRICLDNCNDSRGKPLPYNKLLEIIDKKVDGKKSKDSRSLAELDSMLDRIETEVEGKKGGLEGSIMVSDAFFPFPDGVLVGIREGVSGILQPGGSDRDYLAIKACNAADPKVTMMLTGQRSFKH